MSSALLKGYKTCKIIYGSTSAINPSEEERISGLTHTWRLYVRTPPGFVKSVCYKLHESFVNPTAIVNSTSDNPHCEISNKGWGEFTIQIKITLFNNDKLHCSHYLKLHETTKKNMIHDSFNKPLVSEKEDTVFYKGKYTGKVEGPYVSRFNREEEEYRRIDKCIDWVLEEIEKRI